MSKSVLFCDDVEESKYLGGIIYYYMYTEDPFGITSMSAGPMWASPIEESQTRKV